MGLWIAIATLGAIAIVLATFGIARPLLNDDPAAPVTTSTADTTDSDPRLATIEALLSLSRTFNTRGITDLNAVRTAAHHVQKTNPDPLISDYMGTLLAFLERDTKVSYGEVESAATKARIATPNEAAGVLDSFNPSILETGASLPELAAETRMSGWVTSSSGGVACMLAVQEVTCITNEGELQILSGDGSIDKARWKGSPMPDQTQPLPRDGAMTPDGQIECTSPSPTSLTCTVVNLQHPATIKVFTQ